MNRYIIVITAVVVLLLPLVLPSGFFPSASAISDYTIASVMAVDYESGDISMSVFAQSTAQDGGQTADKPLSQKGGNDKILSGSGKSAAEAEYMLRRSTDKNVFFGHIDAIIVGEELAKQGINAFAPFLLSGNIPMSAAVFVSKGLAGDCLAAAGDNPAAYLNKLQRASAGEQEVRRVNLLDVVSLRAKDYCAAAFPVLSEEMRDANAYEIVFANGYGGRIEGAAAEGYLILTNAMRLGAKTLGGVGVSAINAQTALRAKTSGGRLSGFEARIDISCMAAEAAFDTQTQQRVAVALKDYAKSSAMQCLDAAKSMGADFLNLIDEYRFWHAEDCQRAQKDWKNVLKNLDFGVFATPSVI